MKTQLSLPVYHNASYNIHILGICLVCISACSMFKEKSFYQTDSLEHQVIRREMKTESDSSSQALRIYNSSDSADHQSTVEIYPRGNFKYSAKDGFSGEADRLLINERLHSGALRSGAVHVLRNAKVRSSNIEAEKSLRQTQLKEKKMKPLNLSWLYLAGCALIFLLIWRFRKILQTARLLF